MRWFHVASLLFFGCSSDPDPRTRTFYDVTGRSCRVCEPTSHCAPICDQPSHIGCHGDHQDWTIIIFGNLVFPPTIILELCEYCDGIAMINTCSAIACTDSSSCS